MANVRNLQELKELMTRLTKGLDMSGLELVVDDEEFLRRTGWDHTKNIGAIMVPSPPRTRNRKKPQQQQRLRRINRKQGE